jgi:threonine synthase
VQHRCVECETQFPAGFHPFCDNCGGLVDVDYDLESVELADSPNPYVRFAGLLPLAESHGRLPEATYTPMIRAERLGRALGLNRLYLKNETAQPTKTTKDRMAAVTLAYLRERGVRHFCASSTGNSGSSFAYGIPAYPDMHLSLFTAEEFVSRIQFADHAQVTHFGMRGASFVDAAAFAGVYARNHGLVSESGFFNPGRREGLKLCFLEACDQVDEPIDWYVQAVSSAMGVYGAFKGAKELKTLGKVRRLPHLLCVQQVSCAPMVRAFSEGSEIIRPGHRVDRPSGIAKAILRGDPTRAYPYVRQIVIESGGGFVAVSDDEMRLARQKVEDLEGVSPCFSAAAAVAGVMRLAQKRALQRDACIVVNLTGGDRPETEQTPNVVWIEKGPAGWTAPSPATDQKLFQHEQGGKTPEP